MKNRIGHGLLLGLIVLILVAIAALSIGNMLGCSSSGSIDADDAAAALVVLDIAAVVDEPSEDNITALAASLDLLIETAELSPQQRLVARAAIDATMTALRDGGEFDDQALIAAARGVLREMAAEATANAD